MEATLEPPILKVKNPGKQSPQKAILAKALLAQGYSNRKAAKLAGLSHATILNIKRADVVKGFSNADEQRQVQAVKAQFQNKCILKADSALDLLNDVKLSEASAKELASVALDLAKAGGMLQQAPVEHYHAVMHKFERKDGDTSATASPKIVGESTSS